MKTSTPVKQALRRTRNRQRADDIAAGGHSCRDCGCTDNAACPGGCAWVEIDLCSRCA